MTEADFVERAKGFMRERLGDEAARVTGDTELVDSGILDSLLVLEFFFFLEQLRGEAIEPDKVTISALATIRSAYQLVNA